MAVLGAFSFFAIAGTYYSLPRILKTNLYSVSAANWRDSSTRAARGFSSPTPPLRPAMSTPLSSPASMRTL
jgi:hypothetical protein